MTTIISGWAFKSGGESIRNERKKRYEELKNMGINTLVKEVSHSKGYAHFIKKYENISDSITDLDLLLIADCGNTCFGGDVARNGGFATVKVYID